MNIEINAKYLGVFGKMRTHIKPVAICIHHTCTKTPERTRKALSSQGYSTHFEIDVDGTIYQYREEDLLCSHCGSSNSHCIGVDLTHLDGAEFPSVQIDALRSLLVYLCSKWKIPYEVHEQLSGVYLHRALGSTECPGENFPVALIR